MVTGEKIKYLRESKDIDQKELARLVGCHQSTISSYETARRNSPKKVILNKISNVLGVSIDYLQNSDTDIDVTCNERMFEEAKTLGNLIKTYRKMENLSQKDLAILLNTSDNTVSRIETGNLYIFKDPKYKEIRENLIDLYPNLKKYIEMDIDAIQEIALYDDKGDNNMILLGEKIKNLRKEKGLSLRDLSKLTNKSHSTLGCYENNTTIPDNDTLIKIADVLNTTKEDLLKNTSLNRKNFNKKIYTKPKYEYTEIGNIIKKYREDNNIRQVALADMVGCNINKISRIELGQYDIFNYKYADIKLKLFEIFPGLEDEIKNFKIDKYHNNQKAIIAEYQTLKVPKKLHPMNKDYITGINLLTNHRVEDNIGSVGFKPDLIGKGIPKIPDDIKPSITTEFIMENRRVFDGNTTPFIDRYTCTCGNLKGKLNEGSICLICNTVVKYIGDEDIKDELGSFNVCLQDHNYSERKESFIDKVLNPSKPDTDNSTDIFKDFQLVKPNMSILYFDYLHGQLLDIANGRATNITKETMAMLEMEIKWYSKYMSNDASILEYKFNNLKENFNL